MTTDDPMVPEPTPCPIDGTPMTLETDEEGVCHECSKCGEKVAAPEPDPDAPDWIGPVFEYLETVRQRRTALLRPLNPDESANMEFRMVSEINGESLTQLDSHIGPTIRLASDLEWQVAGMINVLAAPKESPLEHVDKIMGLKAWKRSELHERSAKNAHWKSLVRELRRIADARNDIAHGSWDSFVRDPNLRWGWFVSVIDKPRGKPYSVRTDEWTDEMFREIEITSNLLIFVCESISFVAALYGFRAGVSVVPKNLNRTARVHATSVHRTLTAEEDATLDRLFPPFNPSDKDAEGPTMEDLTP